jgi:hypothetical protein
MARRLLPLTITLLALATTVCGQDAVRRSDGPFLAMQLSTSEAYPDALVTGQLSVVDGCVAVTAKDAGEFLPLWPEGFYVEAGAVHSPDGEIVAGWGDAVSLGGGEVDGSMASEMTGSAVPSRCSDLTPWLVSPTTDF